MVYVIVVCVQVYENSTLFKYYIVYIDRQCVKNHNNSVDFLRFYANYVQ